ASMELLVSLATHGHEHTTPGPACHLGNSPAHTPPTEPEGQVARRSGVPSFWRVWARENGPAVPIIRW
ncbi:MAG: hypothetical protein NT031_20505, partial [Planctomycetota bacterium]|nr:hypothetical protein [Planctomycetota bacterium]